MTGPTGNRGEVLAYERGVNERYLRVLEELIKRQPAIARMVNTTQSQSWTGSAPRPNLSSNIIAPVIGRVALDVHDEWLGSGIYIGTWHEEWDGVQVVSWAAPVADLFFRGAGSDYPMASHVIARRTFEQRSFDIVDYEDDVDVGPRNGADPFVSASSQELSVPTAPRPVARPSRPQAPAPSVQASEEPAPRAPARVESSSASSSEPIQTASPAPQAKVRAKADDSSSPVPMRAEKAVRAALERPRTGHLHALLATLQPDQYRLVTWPSAVPLVVQGHPGTGKTVIATHRAAYLVHPGRDSERLNRVALVGPTDEYVSHVSEVINQLGVTGVDVLSLPALMRTLAAVPGSMKDERDERMDTDWGVGRAVTQAVKLLGERGRLAGNLGHDIRTVVDALSKEVELRRAVCRSNEDLRSWFAQLGGWTRAAGNLRFLPLLAATGQALRPIPRRETYDHLLIDEAQDVRPLEWRIMGEYLAPAGSMSLFGDVNQRRSDWSAASWSQLAIDIELGAEDADLQPEVLGTGFRSTEQILRFANGLLPKDERKFHALREGQPPIVERVAVAQVTDKTVEEAEQLARRHEAGLSAVITVDSQPIFDRLRKRDWKPDGRSRQRLTKEGMTIWVLKPNEARGLEFDGVVVTEPSAFPENVGRLGSLYTSLTRATQELVVVHAKALPRGLRLK
jgi:DNA helicase-2/ATP-dependent DNA helicase PcrA